MATLSKICLQCPFWTEETRRCSIGRNGLFIPLESHILSYCKSSHFKKCSLYKTELTMVESGREGSFYNRRKHHRNPTKQQVVLRYFDDNGHCILDRPKSADTVNLSAGGMQVCTGEPLMNETIIHFSFLTSSSKDKQKGLARVTWCRYEKEAKRYTAGLSFHTSPYLGDPTPKGKTEN